MNAEMIYDPTLSAIFKRRAVRAFEAVQIPGATRDLLLQSARQAPSSFNMQPYRLYWVESPAQRDAVAKLCMSQSPAQTASALVVAVADIGSLRSTAQLQAAWMRQSSFSSRKIREYERTARIGRIIFMPGPLNLFGMLKKALFWLVNVFRSIGSPPVMRHEVFKWASKSTALACQNLMIAAEVAGLNTCPMEGFDGQRLARYLGLSRKHQEILMVIAIGKKSSSYTAQPQWRRPIEATVAFL
ncbi:MAG TPA: nitroreductase family protein [Candidatus Solibacter sp.]|nr:nitroreductase family protein [Candidatus Solibacter sp.]